MESLLETPGMAAYRTVVGDLDNNVYVLQCRATGASILIDAAAEGPALLRLIEPYRPSIILTTHGHADHVGAVASLRAAGLGFAMHPEDGFMVSIPIDRPLTDETIFVGDLAVEVMHTPGHTPGSVCFLADGVLFTGDTLFPGGPGATRFPYSDFDQIIASITDRLFTLDPSTRFYPGHGAPSTLAEEAPSLPEWIARRW